MQSSPTINLIGEGRYKTLVPPNPPKIQVPSLGSEVAELRKELQTVVSEAKLKFEEVDRIMNAELRKSRLRDILIAHTNFFLKLICCVN